MKIKILVHGNDSSPLAKTPPPKKKKTQKTNKQKNTLKFC